MTHIVLHEVGLRDGLQMEKQAVPLAHKIAWTEGLIAAGVDVIQLGSFVNPSKVPQMADTDALFRHFNLPGNKPPNVLLSALVLNEKGLERAFACAVDLICMGVSASETHSLKNTGMSVTEATARIIPMAKQVLTANKRVQVSVQSAFGCGFEGAIPPQRVLGLVKQFIAAGIKNISLADTAGHATPDAVEHLFTEIRRLDSTIECACHLHNTYGLGLANCRAAIERGVTYFESAVGGLGGCPFTKVAGGNVCTEDFVHYLQRIHMRTDLDLSKLIAVAKDIAVYFGRELPGMVYKSGPISFAA